MSARTVAPSIELLATLGPASLERGVITRLEEAGVTLFRINLSHTEVDDLADIVALVRRHSGVPICFDSEGAQIRTGTLAGGALDLEVGSEVVLVDAADADAEAPGAAAGPNEIPLVPIGTARRLEAGDLISLDFNGSLLQVLNRTPTGVAGRVLRGGRVGSNKAVSLQRPIALPALSAKDRRAIAIGRDLGIAHFALSFAGCGEDVEEMRRRIGPGARLISKIETRRALRNFDAIADRSDAVLIDRGDLSREVEIAEIPRIQRALIARGRERATAVYVATNLLESMLESPTPTRAEVNDVYTTLRDGADGLVLAAETAIGRHPVLCANMVMKIAAGRPREAPHLSPVSRERTSRLIAPHGGGPLLTAPRWPVEAVTRTIDVPGDVFDLAQQIAAGTLSPLRGFMSEQAARTVRRNERLPSATPWPCEVTLARAEPTRRRADEGAGTIVALTSCEREGRLGLRLDDVNDEVLSGEVVLLGNDAPRSHPLELSPQAARATFEAHGWSRIAGAVVAGANAEFPGDVAGSSVEEGHVDAVALRRWVSTQFELYAVDGVLLALGAGRKRHAALAQQARVLDALDTWAGRVVVTGLPTLPHRDPFLARRLDAVRLKNLGCNLVGYELDGRGPIAQPARTGSPPRNRASGLRSGPHPPMSGLAGQGIAPR